MRPNQKRSFHVIPTFILLNSDHHGMSTQEIISSPPWIVLPHEPPQESQSQGSTDQDVNKEPHSNIKSSVIQFDLISILSTMQCTLYLRIRTHRYLLPARRFRIPFNSFLDQEQAEYNPVGLVTWDAMQWLSFVSM